MFGSQKECLQSKKKRVCPEKGRGQPKKKGGGKNGRGRSWPNLIWISLFGRIWPIFVDRIWPDRIWPIFLCLVGFPEGWGAEGAGARRVAAEGWTAQNFALFFSLSHRKFHSFFSLWGVFSLNFGGVWKRWGRQMFTFGVLGLSCEAPAAPKAAHTLIASSQQQQQQPPSTTENLAKTLKL